MNVKSRPLDEPFLAISNPLNTDMTHVRSKTVMTGDEEVVTTIFPLPLRATRIFYPLEVIEDDTNMVATAAVGGEPIN